jgi:hypothetical protein
MKKMIGTSCLRENPDYDLMREAGIEWVRAGVGFPFADSNFNTLSDQYKKYREIIYKWRKEGFNVKAITPLYGMMFATKGSPSLTFRRFLPEWVGKVTDKEFYEIMTEAMKFASKDLKDVVTYYQISNEMDITRFRGEMTQEQAAQYMYSCAKGIKLGNPDAKVGINTSCMTNDESVYFYKTLYDPNSDVYFDYAGIDYYFGSHHPGTPYDWIKVINDVYNITKRPIIIAEWGYSSIGDYIVDGWPAEPNKAPNENGEFWVCARGAWAYAWKDRHDEQVQAEYIYEAMKIFANDDRVIGCFQYDWQDDPVCFCGRKNCPHECGWGMIDPEGKPKPAYYSFKKAVEEFFR